MKLDELKRTEIKFTQEIDKIDFEMSKESFSNGYEASLELYAQKYGKTIDKLFTEAERDNEA